MQKDSMTKYLKFLSWGAIIKMILEMKIYDNL